MKAIIFARVSSKDQEEGQSIPAQVRKLTEYALKKIYSKLNEIVNRIKINESKINIIIKKNAID